MNMQKLELPSGWTRQGVLIVHSDGSGLWQRYATKRWHLTKPGAKRSTTHATATEAMAHHARGHK